MKSAFTKWYNYLFALALSALSAGIALILCFAIHNSSVFPLVYISYVMLFSAVIYIGGGFIWQDIYRATKRKETKNWDYPLEQKYIDVAWRIFMPFLTSGAILLISGLVTYLIFR